MIFSNPFLRINALCDRYEKLYPKKGIQKCGTTFITKILSINNSLKKNGQQDNSREHFDLNFVFQITRAVSNTPFPGTRIKISFISSLKNS